MADIDTVGFAARRPEDYSQLQFILNKVKEKMIIYYITFH